MLLSEFAIDLKPELQVVRIKDISLAVKHFTGVQGSPSS